MLEALNRAGFFMAVASSKPQVYVEKILQHFNIAKYFRVIVGSELDGTRVEKDEVINEALERLFQNDPMEKKKVYMIGDRSYDAIGARKAGVDCIGVTYGYGGMEELKEARAHYIVNTVEELKTLLLRGVEGGEKITGKDRIWQIILPFASMMLVKEVVRNVLAIVGATLGQTIPNATFFFNYDVDGFYTSMTADAKVIVEAIGWLAGIFAIRKMAKKSIDRAFEKRRVMSISGHAPAEYAAIVIATLCAAFGIDLFMELSGIAEASEAYATTGALQLAPNLWLGVLIYGFITPIAEELLYRGTIFNCMTRSMSMTKAILVSTILFSVSHMNLVQGLKAVVLGFLFCFAYEYFGYFKVPVILHILTNLMAYVLTYFVKDTSMLVNWPVCCGILFVAFISYKVLRNKRNIF
jgi:membrane protease YdiL (CAAX protease family)